jgi:hypothetical protein
MPGTPTKSTPRTTVGGIQSQAAWPAPWFTIKRVMIMKADEIPPLRIAPLAG